MDRPEVTIHMNVSIDGVIDGEFFGGACGRESSGFYADELWRIGTANLNGATTAKKYHARGKLNLALYEEAGKALDYSDWRGGVESGTWDVILDRRGTCPWEGNTFTYGGRTSRVVEILTERAPLAYLAFLRHLEIPYLVCGAEELDLAQACAKLRSQFGIERMVVGGGSRINGAFLEAGLVDRISMVVQPYVSGNLARRTSFNTLGRFVERHFACVRAEILPNGGVHLVYECDDEPGTQIRIVDDIPDPDPE